MNPTLSRRNWLIAAVLGVLFLVLYGLTLTDWHSGDDLQWVMQVEDAVKGRRGFHPSSADSIIDPNWVAPTEGLQVRYLFELPTSSTIYRLTRDAGLADKAYPSVQWTHAVAGLIGIVFFYAAVSQITPLTLSIIISVGLGVSYAWWYYSTHLDYTVASHAFSCVLLFVLVSMFRAKEPRSVNLWALALGVVNALVVLYLMTGVLLVPVILVALWLHFRKSGAVSILLRYVISFGVFLAILGGVMWVASTGTLPTPVALLGQATYSGAFAHDFSITDIPKAFYGAAKGFATFPGLAEIEPNQFLAEAGTVSKLIFYAWQGVLVVVLLLPFLGILVLRKRLGEYTALTVALVGWFVVQLPFAIYWEPTYIKWWTGALVPWWALVGLLLARIEDRQVWYRRLSIVVGVWVTLLFAVNLFSKFLPNAMDSDEGLVSVANTLSEETQPDDLFVSLDESNILDFYLPYFGDRRTLSYHMAFLQNGRDEAVATEIVRQAVDTVVERGGRVYVYDCGRQDPAERAQLFSEGSSFTPSWEFGEQVSVCELNVQTAVN
jgi:hypothetical protein